uniref:Uncharacterized protein n=1 Tax=Rhizophora mucronata TaxID=61149 RepID=A0A2P2QDE8_RHIMU
MAQLFGSIASLIMTKISSQKHAISYCKGHCSIMSSALRSH